MSAPTISAIESVQDNLVTALQGISAASNDRTTIVKVSELIPLEVPEAPYAAVVAIARRGVSLVGRENCGAGRNPAPAPLFPAPLRHSSKGWNPVGARYVRKQGPRGCVMNKVLTYNLGFKF